MRIPTEPEDSAAFMTRVAGLIRRKSTHLYVDTSFLMWLTKVGTTSRGELTNWLKAECPGRVHVPIWSVHEYLRHHVATTILGELEEKTRELNGVASGTYAYFRPFMDGALDFSSANVDAFRMGVRSMLTELKNVAQVVGSWKRQYGNHAGEVISFINDCALSETEIFDYMSTIEALSQGRFVGRIPPGFQDRGKRDQRVSPESRLGEAGAALGGNRWGDLMLWKEILEHAKSARARCVVVFSNDRKNDWFLNVGSDAQIDDELKKLKTSWRAVPHPHPMLELEARLAAGVRDLILLDSPYLAALLWKIAGDAVKSFVDVAIVPDQPEPESERERRAAAFEKRLKEDTATKEAAATEAGARFPDSDSVFFSFAALRRAIFESRGKLPKLVSSLVAECQATIESKRTISELLTRERLAAFDHKMLVVFGRELHDLSLSGNPGWKEAAADLASILGELPIKTAGCLYLGLLASMYLERTNNKPKLPPESPIASILLETQEAHYGRAPLEALRAVIMESPRLPLYVPDPERPSVTVNFDIEQDTEGGEEVRSITLNSTQVLLLAQGVEELLLSRLFAGRTSVTGGELVEKACSIFVVPVAQVERTDDFDREFTFAPDTGFENPPSTFISKAE